MSTRWNVMSNANPEALGVLRSDYFMHYSRYEVKRLLEAQQGGLFRSLESEEGAYCRNASASIAASQRVVGSGIPGHGLAGHKLLHVSRSRSREVIGSPFGIAVNPDYETSSRPCRDSFNTFTTKP